MHWLRGSGLAWPGRYGSSTGDIARPLLCISQAIPGVLPAAGLDTTPGQTNDDITILRNRIRHELLPYLERYNPNLRRTLSQCRAARAAMKPIWRRKRTASIPRYVVKRPAEEVNLALLSLALYQETPALAHRVIRRGVDHLRPATVTPGGSRPYLSDRAAAHRGRDRSAPQPPRKSGGRAWIHHVTGEEANNDGCITNIGSTTFLSQFLVNALCRYWAGDYGRRSGYSPRHLPCRREVPTASIPVECGGTNLSRLSSETTAYIDGEACGEGRLVVRTWRKGDRFRPLGMQNEKKLHDFFIDARVPRAFATGFHW